MPNIILTTDCQRKCQYCFAKDKIKENFSWEAFTKAVDFISTGPKIVNLLGGEPTLHKDFCRFLEHLIREDFKIQVFTNGMSEDVDNIKRIIDENELRPEQLLFCVNLNSPEDRTEKEIELQDNFLKNSRVLQLSFSYHL
jgi:organic radical activating enzyme